MVLPHFGGTPAVWNTCMVFFQAILLAGYAYVHGSVKWFGVRRQAGFHLVLLLVPLLVLPITLNTESVPTELDNPVFWLLLQLLLGVGLPFFAVSTSAPLLQMWFTKTGHTSAKDPYFLYAASNLGSMIALLGYPILVEPTFALDAQGLMWKYGYMILVALTACCAILMWRASRSDQSSEAAQVSASDGGSEQGRTDETLGVWRQFRWIILAFVPSSLMLGVTTHVTTEIAPVPLLWVVPLAIYLFTFVLVFAKHQILPHAWVIKAVPFIIVPTALMTVQSEDPLGMLPLTLHMLAFFLVSMACHGEMAADRPGTDKLTWFYLLMSVGGVLGGIVNSIVSPLVFDTLVEYPLVMVIACVVLATKPNFRRMNSRTGLDVGLAVVGGAAVSAMLFYLLANKLWVGYRPNFWTVVVPAFICWFCLGRPSRFALMFASVLAATMISYEMSADQTLYAGRNFYGTKRVFVDPENTMHSFLHGATIHGKQATSPERADVPRMYFHPDGPVGDVFDLINRRPGRKEIAVIGLGVGAMASPLYAKNTNHFTFYEIDPEVERIARNPEYFTFLERCATKPEVVLGDGRLTLANAPDGHYDAIFLDAFSSDAVPTHLLTREAISLYASKLRPRGILIFNVTNRFLDLAPLLAGLADDAGFAFLVRDDVVTLKVARRTARCSSKFVVMGQRMQDIQSLQSARQWKPAESRDDYPVWTDKYTNVFSVLDW